MTFMHTAPLSSPSYDRYGAMPRWRSLGLVIAMHALLLAALLQLEPVRKAFKEAAPLMVNLIPADPDKPRQAQPEKPLPLKEFRPDRVELPPIQISLTAEPRPTDFAPEPPVKPAPLEFAAAQAQPPARAEPPRFDMAYLNNPAPAYPPLAKRLNQQGRVLLRVRVSVAGLAEQVEIQSSSGVERLDVAAMEAVRRWRFVPARRGEEAVPGWAIVPIQFTLS
ncbi:MAG: energy transducer TonB [Betaproteobacteria bacterium]|nr:energy transducer TonB [Betaproteobacteria bacterium]